MQPVVEIFGSRHHQALNACPPDQEDRLDNRVSAGQKTSPVRPAREEEQPAMTHPTPAGRPTSAPGGPDNGRNGSVEVFGCIVAGIVAGFDRRSRAGFVKREMLHGRQFPLEMARVAEFTAAMKSASAPALPFRTEVTRAPGTDGMATSEISLSFAEVICRTPPALGSDFKV